MLDLVAQSNGNDAAPAPFLSVAITHYRNPQYLIAALRVLDQQAPANFEVVVSDDASGGEAVTLLREALEATSLRWKLFAQGSNQGMGGNLHDTLHQCSGQYLLIMGQDDALDGPTWCQMLARRLRELQPAVAYTNYCDVDRTFDARRAVRNGLLGSGPVVARQQFRNFGFMSGLVVSRTHLLDFDLRRGRHLIFFQVYMLTRIVASGGALASLSELDVIRGIALNGQRTATWAAMVARPGEVERRNTFPDLVESASWALEDAGVPLNDAVRRVVREVLLFNLPDALLGYRRQAGWMVAARLACVTRPGKVAAADLRVGAAIELVILHAAVSMLTLVLPLGLLGEIKDRLAVTVRRFRSRSRISQLPRGAG